MEQELFDYFASAHKLEGLQPYQRETFLLACKKAVVENPGLDFADYRYACGIYLNFIRDFPDIDLGQPNPPAAPHPE
jgi:hypothetical protein